jgi:subtilisin family serine protease
MKKLLFLVVLTAISLTATALVSNHTQARGLKLITKENGIPNRFIVVLNEAQLGSDMAAPTVESDAQYFASIYGGKVDQVYSSAIKGFVAEMSLEQAKTMSGDSNILYIEQDAPISIESSQLNAQWNLDRVDQRNLPWDGVYNYTNSGAGVHAYILDTGIRATHVEFGGRADAAYDNVGDGQNGFDCNGHGTHVAGIIGAATWGVAKNVSLHGVRVIPCNGNGQISNLIDGINWVTAHRQNPAVANISAAAAGSSPSLESALTASINSGVVYAVAAGNGAWDACNWTPARTPAALTVGASDETDLRALYSNKGPCIDLYAPGNQIVSTWSSSDTATNNLSGTSMASPMVAGVAALYFQTHPTASSSTVIAAVLGSTTNGVMALDDPTSPNKLLYSFVDGAPSPTPSPSPTVTPSPTPSPSPSPSPDPHVKVTVKKRIQGTVTQSGTTEFPYSAVNMSTSSFQLQNDQDYIDPSLQPSTSQNPIVVTESPVQGWQLMSISCIDAAGGVANASVDLTNHQVSVVATDGQQIECTFTSQELGLTAAGATVSGQIVDSAGRGVKGVQMVLLDPTAGTSRVALTNAFGLYSFDNVTAGHTYMIATSAKRYRITPTSRAISVSGDLANVSFVAQAIW